MLFTKSFNRTRLILKHLFLKRFIVCIDSSVDILWPVTTLSTENSPSRLTSLRRIVRTHILYRKKTKKPTAARETIADARPPNFKPLALNSQNND